MKIAASKEKPVKLAVYGSLRSGFHNHGILKDSTLLGTYVTEGSFTMYDSGAYFPIVIDRGLTPIEYELYEITDNSVMQSIHKLEGCTGIPGDKDNWYDLNKITTPEGEAWIYVMHTRQPLKEIESGIWFKQEY